MQAKNYQFSRECARKCVNKLRWRFEIKQLSNSLLWIASSLVFSSFIKESVLNTLSVNLKSTNTTNKHISPLRQSWNARKILYYKKAAPKIHSRAEERPAIKVRNDVDAQPTCPFVNTRPTRRPHYPETISSAARDTESTATEREMRSVFPISDVIRKVRKLEQLSNSQDVAK